MCVIISGGAIALKGLRIYVRILIIAGVISGKAIGVGGGRKGGKKRRLGVIGYVWSGLLARDSEIVSGVRIMFLCAR